MVERLCTYFQFNSIKCIICLYNLYNITFRLTICRLTNVIPERIIFVSRGITVPRRIIRRAGNYRWNQYGTLRVKRVGSLSRAIDKLRCMFEFYIFGELCVEVLNGHVVSYGQSLVCRHEIPGSIPGQYMWKFWWENCVKCERGLAAIPLDLP